MLRTFLTSYFWPGVITIVKGVANALGEKTVTSRDALGRVIGVQTYASNSTTPLRVTSTSYAANHHSFTVTEGTNSGAISTTTFSDNDGQTVLTIQSPSGGQWQYGLQSYDRAGRRIEQDQYSSTGTSPSLSSFTRWTYDGLSRVKTETTRDWAITTFSYDAVGNLTNRSMPGNLTWSAAYSSSGQIQSEQDSSGGQVTRQSTYSYYPAGNAWAGLLKTVTDGRSVTRTNSYNDFLRLSGVSITGAQPEQQMSWSCQYDARGLATNLAQSFANSSTGSGTEVRRKYGPYGQVSTDKLILGTTTTNSANQEWNSAGRRTRLSGGGTDAQFQYRADSLMTAAKGATFGYGNNGLLTGRTNTYRSLTVDQRDGMGRPLQATTRVSTQSVLAESWTWTSDGFPAIYTAALTNNYTNTRRFTYGDWNRRLSKESFNLDNSKSVTNTYTFDNGASNSLGVLTKAGASGSMTNSWSGTLDGFSRLTWQTNTAIHRPAYGTVNGPATLRAYLNGQKVDVRTDPGTDGPWSTDLSLLPGTTNTLTVYADHTSGRFTTNRSSTFTVTNSAFDKVESKYDGAGYVTNRIWRTGSGDTLKTQTLIWDGFGRLVKISERDTNNNGFNLESVFDGLGRQVRTIETAVSNNVALTSYPKPITVTFTYDPQVEFLVVGIGITQGNQTRQDALVYGPDISGAYGGMQGVGGLEMIITTGSGAGNVGILNDAFGNVLGAIANGVVISNTARVNLYGPVENYAPPRLSLNAPAYASLTWRTRAINAAGLVQLGTRPYDPMRCGFLSDDPLGHGSDPALITAFQGNPVAFFDPSGRCSQDVKAEISYLNDYYRAQRGAFQAYTEYQNAAYERQVSTSAAIDSYVGAVDRLAQANSYQAYQQSQLSALGGGDSGALLSWGQQWRYDTTRTFDNTLATLANWSTLGTANSASIALTGSDLWQNQSYGTSERIVQAGMLGLMAIPGLGLGAKEVMSARTAESMSLKLPGIDTGLAGSSTLGYTTPQGAVFLQPGLSRATQAHVLRHEGVHAFLTPQNGSLVGLRQDIRIWGYQNSDLLRYSEEAIAETVGSGSLWQGLRHPLVNDYGIRSGRLVLEGGAVGGGIFGAGYLGYQLGGGQ